MDRSTARRIVAVAVLIGALAQALFYRTALGLNLGLLVAGFITAAWLLRRPDARLDRADLWIAPAALAFAAFPALRADPALAAFDLLAAAGLTLAAVAAIGGAMLTRRSVLGLVAVAAQGSLLLAGGAVQPLRAAEIGDEAGAVRREAARFGPVARGLLIAAPLVLVFAVLFAAADAVFEDLLNDVFSFDLDLGELPGRAAIAVVAAWLAAGALVTVGRAVFAPEGRSLGAAAAGALVRRPRLGITEAVVVLVAVDLLFAVFVGLQVAYLFGGRDTLAATGMTYSEYARQGFFELVIVAFLAGGLIAGLDALVGTRSRAYLAGAVALAALALIVLASATLRLKLYQDAYGWTELRFYVYAAIAWLGLGAVATIALLLTARMRWLAHAIGLLFVGVALAVNAVGPQAFVAASNLARVVDPSLVPPDGRAGLDAWYLSTLGEDAVPVMIRAVPYVDPQDRNILEGTLRSYAQTLQRPEVTVWPAWNLARQQARDALAGRFAD